MQDSPKHHRIGLRYAVLSGHNNELEPAFDVEEAYLLSLKIRRPVGNESDRHIRGHTFEAPVDVVVQAVCVRQQLLVRLPREMDQRLVVAATCPKRAPPDLHHYEGSLQPAVSP